MLPHREGLDIDLNRSVQVLDANGNDTGTTQSTQCENDRDLFFVVNKWLTPVPGRIPRNMDKVTGVGGTLPPQETALLCERNRPGSPVFGLKHIDITTIEFQPIGP